VYIPSKQRGSGMAALQVGDVDRAREHALANLRLLGDAVREGHTVVCSEPTATLMLQTEYAKLTDDIDAALVAANTLDLNDYLVGLQARGRLPTPVHPLALRAGYHQPCHQRALGIGSPTLDLLGLIPSLRVAAIEQGCSGMGGIFGLYKSQFRASLRAGRGLRSCLRDPDLDLGVTDCGTCRLQMEQGTRKQVIHPIKLLAASYGFPSPRLPATATDQPQFVAGGLPSKRP
jgi:Fe-S oxidoreductase